MLENCNSCGINTSIIQHHSLFVKEVLFKIALELVQGMELAAKNVRELIRELPSTTGPITVVQNPVSLDLHPHVTDVVKLDIFPLFANNL